MKTRLSLIFALLLLCLGTGAVLAQTPDSCGNETGAAYGLCNAYCDAMDCDSDNPSASATACEKVRTRFQNVAGRDLPCEVPDCPCNDPSVSFYFSEFAAGNFPITQCRRFDVGVEIAGPTPEFVFVFAYEYGELICGPTNEGGALLLSLEQVQACSALLEQAANNQGVTCEF